MQPPESYQILEFLMLLSRLYIFLNNIIFS